MSGQKKPISISYSDQNSISYEDYKESVPLDELISDTALDQPETHSYDLGGVTPSDMEDSASSSIENTKVSPALQALFDSGVAGEIDDTISEKVNSTEADPILEQVIDSKSDQEWIDLANDRIRHTDTSEINSVVKTITSIPKEMMLHVDDLHRRTGMPKKYIMRNLEKVAAKAEERDYKEFVNTKTGPLTKEHLKHPFNQARMRGEFTLLSLEPEIQRLEELGKVHSAFTQMLQMKSLSPEINDLQMQNNFWKKNYPNALDRGDAIKKFKPYIDKLETKFWQDEEDYSEAYNLAERMKESWLPNSLLNFMVAGGSNFADKLNILEEVIKPMFGGEEVSIAGEFSGDRLAKQFEQAAEMFNQDSYGNWISPEWYARGRGISKSVLTMLEGQGLGGIGGSSALFGAGAAASGVDAAEEAGLTGTDKYAFATGEGAIEAGMNYIGGKVFGVGTEAMMSNMLRNVNISSPKSIVQAFKDYGKDGVKKALYDFGVNLPAENIEEVATELLHAINEKESGVDPDALTAEKLLPRIKETVIQSSIMGGTPGAIEIGKALLVNQAHKNQLSKIEAEKIEREKIAADSSELAEKDPKALENFFEKVLPNQEAIEVNADIIVKTYKQEAPEIFEEDMKTLGLTPKEVLDRAELGVKVEVKATKMLAYSAGRRLVDKVGIPNINIIGQNSISENDEISKELAESVKKMVDDVAEIDKNMREQSPILEKMVEQLKENEYFTKKDARKLTAVVDSMYKNLYLNGGLKPDEYLRDVELALSTPNNLEGKMHPDRHNLMKKGEKAAQSELRLEQAAMYHNPRKDFNEFVSYSRADRPKKQSYYSFGNASFAPDIDLRVSTDTVKHDDNDHINQNSIEILPDIISSGEVISIKESAEGSKLGQVFTVIINHEGQHYGIAFTTGKTNGYIDTVFKGSYESLKNDWQDRSASIEASDRQSALGHQGLPRSGYHFHLVDSDANIIKSSDNGNIPDDAGSVNNNADGEQLNQNELTNSESPKGWVDFTKNKKKIINLTATSDASTVMHEFMHIYVHDAINLVNSGKASEEFVYNIEDLIEFATEGKSHSFVELDKNAQERIARAFEAYLMEGRAPSTRLAESFDAIKKWMLKVYKTIRNLNVELNDDVRGVFDSILASNEEIEDARRYYNDRKSYTELYKADKAKADEIKAMRKKENLSAEQKQIKRRMYIFKKINGGINSIRKEIEKVLKEEPLYKATIPSITDQGGLNTAEITKLVGKDRATQLKKHGKSLIKKAGTLRIESEEFLDLASDNNMTIEEFVNYLIDAPSLKEQVEKKVKERLADEEKRISEEEGLGEDDIYHTDGRLRILLSEYNLIKEMLGTSKGIQEYQLTMKAVSDAARDIIGDNEGRTASGYYKFAQAEAKAGRRARELFEKVSKTEDETEIKELQEEASEYVRREMLNHACVLEAVKARDLIKKIKQRYATKKIESTTKNVENTYREIILAIAQKFKLMKQDHRGYDVEGAAAGLESNIQVQDVEGNVDPRLKAKELKEFLPEDVVIPDWVGNTPLPEDYKSISDLTINQIIELDELLGELVARGKTDFNILKSEFGNSVNEVAGSSISYQEEFKDLKKLDPDGTYRVSLTSMKQNKLVIRSIWFKAISVLRHSGSRMKMVEFLFDMMDGFSALKSANGKNAGAHFGPMMKVFNKASEVENEYETKLNIIMTALEPHFKALYGFKKRMSKEFGADKYQIPSVPVPEELRTKKGINEWDAEKIICCVLNLGNIKNDYALRNGYDFAPERLTRYFTNEELFAVQGIWDTLDTLYPELDAVNYKLTNRHLVKEEAQQFTVVTNSGATVTLRGGYYLLGYDNFLSAKVAELQEINTMIDEGNKHHTSSGTPKDGATKARLEDEDGNPIVRYPPALSLRVLDNHLRNTIRTITHAEFIKEIDMLTRHQSYKDEDGVEHVGWQDTVRSKFGYDNYKAIREWVVYLARPEQEVKSTVDKIFDFCKNRNTELALGFRAKTGLKQRLSLFNGVNAMGEDGYKYLLRGMKDIGFKSNLYGSTANDTVKLINELSAFMKNRGVGFDRDVKEALDKFNLKKNRLNILGKEFTTQQIRELAFWFVQANDRAAVYSLWQGAFTKGMETNIVYTSPALDTSNMSEEEILNAKENDLLKHQQAAVEYADYIVRSTQPSTQAPDLSAIQRDKGKILRFFTSFMTFTLKAGNRLSHHIAARKHGKISTFDLAKHIAIEWSMPALVMLSLAALIYDEEDDPEWYDWALGLSGVEGAMASVPFLRSTIPAVKYKSSIFALPGTERIEDMLYTPGMPSFMLAGEFLLGIPAANIYRDAKKEYKKITGHKEK